MITVFIRKDLRKNFRSEKLKLEKREAGQKTNTEKNRNNRIKRNKEKEE